ASCLSHRDGNDAIAGPGREGRLDVAARIVDEPEERTGFAVEHAQPLRRAAFGDDEQAPAVGKPARRGFDGGAEVEDFAIAAPVESDEPELGPRRVAVAAGVEHAAAAAVEPRGQVVGLARARERTTLSALEVLADEPACLVRFLRGRIEIGAENEIAAARIDLAALREIEGRGFGER